MPLSANVSIVLDAHSPKKDATYATDGGHATGANDVTIWAASGVEVGNPQQVVGCFMKLRRYALTELKNMQPSAGPTIVHMPLYAGDSEIEIDGTPTAEECRIEIGATLVDRSQSHFINRTFDRLIEVLLEASK